MSHFIKLLLLQDLLKLLRLLALRFTNDFLFDRGGVVLVPIGFPDLGLALPCPCCWESRGLKNDPGMFA